MSSSNNIIFFYTCYVCDWERSIIALACLRDFRRKNGKDKFLLVVSDGTPRFCEEISTLADMLIILPGPIGLQGGEIRSIQVAHEYAFHHGYKYIFKMCTDVLFAQKNWAEIIPAYAQSTQRKMLTPHWDYSKSEIVGTKFYFSELAFAMKYFPNKTHVIGLEEKLTRNIEMDYNVRDVVYIIGGRHDRWRDALAEMRNWGYEHGHSLYHFKTIKNELKLGELLIYFYLASGVMRIKRAIKRELGKISKSVRASLSASTPKR